MQTSFKDIIKAGAIASAFIFCAPAAMAQTTPESRALLDRITQLEIQVQNMSRGGAYVPGAVTSSLATPAPAMGADNGDVQKQLQDLTDKVERTSFQIQQLQTDLEKMKSDNDVRFGQLEKRPSPQAQTEAPVTGPAAEPVADNALPEPVDTTAGLSPEALYQKAYGALQKKDYAVAEKGFHDFLAKNPDHTLAANAQYWLGESYYARGNYKAASAVFAEAYQKYPKAQKTPEALLKLGLSLAQQKRTKDACTVLRQLTKEYPAAAGSVATRAESELKRMKCQ